MGTILAIRHDSHLLRTVANSTASVLILTGCFAGKPIQLYTSTCTTHVSTTPHTAAFQELSRRARCTHSPLNSAVGGAATGALLFAAHGAAPPRGAVICGTAGAALHWAGQKIDFQHSFPSLLAAWGLLDESAVPPPRPQAKKNTGEVDIDTSPAWWRRVRTYMPFRKMSDEEWEEYQRKKKEEMERERRAALQGSSARIGTDIDSNSKDVGNTNPPARKK